MKQGVPEYPHLSTRFYTVRLKDHRSDLLTRHIGALRRAMRCALRGRAMKIDSIVILPNLVHAICTLPIKSDAGVNSWNTTKSQFAAHLPRSCLRQALQPGATPDDIWQPGVAEYAILDAEDYAAHRLMVLTAPVQYGLVPTPEDWPHSSIHRDRDKGLQIPQGSYPVVFDRPQVNPREPLVLSG